MSIHRALSELAPNASWCMDGEQTYNNLQWNSSDITKPTETEVNNKIAEIEAAFPLKYLREERDAMLVESDWTQGADVPVGIKTTYQTYRQALRDFLTDSSKLTMDDNGMLSITWPTKPS